MKAININWDVDREEDRASLPKEISIPAGIEDEDEVSDYLSDATGFCHNGFSLIKDDEEEYQKYASTQHAQTSWYIDDVIAAAEANDITLTPEQADTWWNQNENVFKNLVVEAGNGILMDMDYEGYGAKTAGGENE